MTATQPVQQQRPSATLAVVLGIGIVLVNLLVPRGLDLIDGPIWALQDLDTFWLLVTRLLLLIAGFGIALLLFALQTARVLGAAGLSGLALAAVTLLLTLAISFIGACIKDGWQPGTWPAYAAIAGVAVLLALLLRRLQGRSSAAVRTLSTALLASAALGLGALLIGLRVVLAPAPLPIDGVRLEREDRARLTRTIRTASPRNLAPGAVQRLTLTAEDLNQLATWGLSLGSEGRYAYVSMRDDQASIAVSLRVPLPLTRDERYFNLSAVARPRLSDGDFEPRVDSLRLGPLPFPAWLADRMLETLWHFAAADEQLGVLLDSVYQVQVATG